jgi:hypothetical protein
MSWSGNIAEPIGPNEDRCLARCDRRRDSPDFPSLAEFDTRRTFIVINLVL